MVTVDTNTHTNMVVWKNNGSGDVAYYNIYRESQAAGDYQLIGSRHADSLGVFTDPIADPFNRSWRYKLSAVDACGYESELSKPHKTIHLTRNLGTNDAVNLIWDQYEGFDFPTYDIYKYLPATGWTYLTGIASSQSTSYTDQPVPEEQVQYFIEIEPPGGSCEVSDRKAATLNSSRSNRKGKLKISTWTGSVVDLGRLDIYPNPSSGLYTLNLELANMSGAEMKVFDASGKLILHKKFSNLPQRLDSQIDLRGYEDGIYQVLLKAGNVLHQRTLIKN
jgi:hypothetical protein